MKSTVLLVVVALVITTLSWTAGNTLRASDDEEAYTQQPAVSQDEITANEDSESKDEPVIEDKPDSEDRQEAAQGAQPSASNPVSNGKKTDTRKYLMDSVEPVEDIVMPSIVVTIEGAHASVTYDGEKHSVSGYEITSIKEVTGEETKDTTLYSENDIKFTGDAAVDGVDADTYKMDLSAANFVNTNSDFADVTFRVTDGYLKINKRKVILTSASDSKPYDGKPLTNDAVSVSGDGWADGDGAMYDVTGSQTEVGSSLNEFSYILNGEDSPISTMSISSIDEGITKPTNYDIETVYGRLTVTEAVIDNDDVNKKLYNLTIHYVDQSGDAISGDYNGKYTAGQKFRVKSPVIDGYKPDYDVIISDDKGMPAKNLELDVTYSKIVNAGVPANNGDSQVAAAGLITEDENGDVTIVSIDDPEVPMAAADETAESRINMMPVMIGVILLLLAAFCLTMHRRAKGRLNG